MGYAEYAKKPSTETSNRIDFIKLHPEMTAEELSEIFNLSKATTNSLISCYLPKKVCIPWTKEQDDFLKNNKSKPTSWLIENIPGTKRTGNSIKRRRRILKLIQKPAHNPWTKEQDDFLKKHQDKTMKWLIANIPKPERTESAIQGRRMLLGLTQKPAEWTEEQINFLKENADKTKKWVADHMPEPKKSETAVYDMYTVLGILNKKMTPFTKEELDFIENHMNMANQWILENKPGPKRTIGSIKTIKSKLRKKSVPSEQ